MTVCEICSSEEFEEIYGMFYCKLCSTLSQSHGMVQDSAVDTINYHGSQLIKLANPFTSQDTKKSGIQSEDSMRPWKTLEGFQFVLKQQVEALISLGIQPEIKEVVFKIWIHYLRFTKQAFMPIPNNEGTKERLRDKYISKSSNSGAVTKTKIQSWIERQIKLKNKKTDHDSDESEENVSLSSKVEENGTVDGNSIDGTNKNLSNKENISDSNAIKTSDTDIAGERDKSNCLNEENLLLFDQVSNYVNSDAALNLDFCDNLHLVDAEINDSLSIAFQRSIFRMNLPLTLSLLHSAMLYFDSNVLANDIVRLVKLKKLPYNDHKNWPQDMLLNITDYFIFFPKAIPEPEQVNHNTFKLFKLLNLKPLKNPSFENISLRLFLKLHLPMQIYQIIVQIINKLKLSENKIDFNFYFWKIKLDFASVCLAIIIVALKIVFLLNDHYENIISDCVEKISNLKIFNDLVLFNWKSWRLYTSKRFPNTSIQNIRDLESISSTKVVLDKYDRRPEQKVNSKKSFYDCQRRLRFDNLAKSFRKLMRQIDSDSDLEVEESPKFGSPFTESKVEINPFQSHDVFFALDGKNFVDKYTANTKIPEEIIPGLLVKKCYFPTPLTKFRPLQSADRRLRKNIHRVVTMQKPECVLNSNLSNNCINFKPKLNSTDKMDKNFCLNSNACFKPHLRNNIGTNSCLSSSTSIKSNLRTNIEANSCFDSNTNLKLNLQNNIEKNSSFKSNTNFCPEHKLSSIENVDINSSLNTDSTKATRKRLKAVRKVSVFDDDHLGPVDLDSYSWLIDTCGQIFDCNPLRVHAFVQRIERRLFDFEHLNERKSTRIFGREKMKKKKRKVLSMQSLKNLLRDSSSRKLA